MLSGYSALPLLVADRREQLADHLDDRADADPDQEGGELLVVGGGADHGAEDCRGPGDQAERQRAGRGDGCSSRASGATIARPSVVL